MADYKLDFLYGQYYTQLLRHTLQPTCLEKKILESHAKNIKNYILQYTTSLKKKVDKYKEKTDKSYVWNREYYNELIKQFKDDIEKFEGRLKGESFKELLYEDFSIISKDLDEMFPNHMPKSSIREVYLQSTKLNNKQN